MKVDTNGAEESVLFSEVSFISEVEMHERVYILEAGEGPQFKHYPYIWWGFITYTDTASVLCRVFFLAV